MASAMEISERIGMKITQATTIVEHFVLGQSTVNRQALQCSALWHTALSFVLHCVRILKWGNGIGKIRTTGTALWQSGDMGEKCNKKQSTLEIDFFVNFHRKRMNFCMELP